MTDLEKLVEQWAREASDGKYVYDCDRAWLMNFCRLAMAHAAEEAAKVCEENEKLWHHEYKKEYTPYKEGMSDGAAYCAGAIRERFKAP